MLVLNAVIAIVDVSLVVFLFIATVERVSLNVSNDVFVVLDVDTADCVVVLVLNVVLNVVVVFLLVLTTVAVDLFVLN